MSSTIAASARPDISLVAAALFRSVRVRATEPHVAIFRVDAESRPRDPASVMSRKRLTRTVSSYRTTDILHRSTAHTRQLAPSCHSALGKLHLGTDTKNIRVRGHPRREKNSKYR
jgi:hypothetical protein